jgi:hypothetical protein
MAKLPTNKTNKGGEAFRDRTLRAAGLKGDVAARRFARVCAASRANHAVCNPASAATLHSTPSRAASRLFLYLAV